MDPFILIEPWLVWCGCKVDASAVRKAGCGHTRKRAYARAANHGAAMARRTLSPLILNPVILLSIVGANSTHITGASVTIC